MQPYRSTYNYNNGPSSPKVLQRNASGKISYSPGHWKSYIPSDLIRRPEESRSSYESGGQRLSSPGNSYYQHQQQQQMMGQNSQWQEKQRKKEQMLKRVKEIQQRVLPLIENDTPHRTQQDQNLNLNWRNKMQQKVAKLQTAVDAVQKSLQIRFQKQVLELERRMQQKYNEIQAKMVRNSNMNMNNNSNNNVNRQIVQ